MTNDANSDIENRRLSWYVRKLVFEVLLPAGVAGGIWLNFGFLLSEYTQNQYIVVPVTAAATVIGGFAVLMIASEVNNAWD